MPIEVASRIRALSEDEFHAAAHRVLGIVFNVHNDLGRLLDEGIYKKTILRRCQLAEIVPAQREVEIKVRFKDFKKSYFMDFFLITSDTAFALTSLKKMDVEEMENHLQRLLRHTRLAAIQWVNMNNHEVSFRTLQA